MEIDWYDGGREALLGLFRLAEDSPDQLHSYLHLGRVLVARRDGEAVGHLQLTPTDERDVLEIKNMAVAGSAQRSGIGRALIDRAIQTATEASIARLVVATGAADVGNLRFYQRCGFRMHSIERDAFTPDTGYPDPIEIDGIELRDRVWLSRDL
jgi:N-acetylglutamate synthase-like GNAT family acetyltransferase